MSVESEQGYLIVAVNTESVDYVSLAGRLARSLRAFHPDCKICLLTDEMHSHEHFDYVRQLPFGDQCGYANDWQAWYASPFRETIKLEADMLVVSAIDHWWRMLRHRDVVISTGSRDFYDQTNQSRYYRKTFDINHLPDVYNAITYWRLSEVAKEFWHWCRLIFSDWDSYKTLLKFPAQSPDTDTVYAMAAQIVGAHNVTLPFVDFPRITHMKQHLLPLRGRDWTQELTWEITRANLRINTIAQWGCFHYHNKHWTPEHEQ